MTLYILDSTYLDGSLTNDFDLELTWPWDDLQHHYVWFNDIFLQIGCPSIRCCK